MGAKKKARMEDSPSPVSSSSVPPSAASASMADDDTAIFAALRPAQSRADCVADPASIGALAADDEFLSALDSVGPVCSRAQALGITEIGHYNDSTHNRASKRPLKPVDSHDSSDRFVKSSEPTGGDESDCVNLFDHDLEDPEVDRVQSDDEERRSTPRPYSLGNVQSILTRIDYILHRDSLPRSHLARSVHFTLSKISRLLSSIKSIKQQCEYFRFRRWIFLRDQKFVSLVKQEIGEQIKIQQDKLNWITPLKQSAVALPASDPLHRTAAFFESSISAESYQQWLNYELDFEQRSSIDSTFVQWLKFNKKNKQNSQTEQDNSAPSASNGAHSVIDSSAVPPSSLSSLASSSLASDPILASLLSSSASAAGSASPSLSSLPSLSGSAFLSGLHVDSSHS